MASELLKDLDKRVVKDGESWARLRSAFASCISQYGNGAHLAAEYIGGQSVNRDFKGTDKARDPITPIPGARQREALKLLVDQVLSDKAFQFSPALLRKLVIESWQDGRSFGGSDYPIFRLILNLQKIALDQCLDSSVLQRIQNHEMQSDPAAIRSRSPRSSVPSATGSSPSWPRRPRARRNSRSRRSAGTSSASTSSGSARWYSVPGTIPRRWGTSGSSSSSAGSPRRAGRQEPGAAAPR